MQSRSRILVAGLALVTVIGIGACSRGDEGMAEHAGKQIDQAAHGAADAAQNAAAGAEQKMQ